MNVSQKTRQQAAGRLFLQFVAAAGIGFAVAGFLGALFAALGALAAPSIIASISYAWTHTAEWTKLGVTENYSTAAMKSFEAKARQNLRDTLDQIGVEALDEVEAAIARREEDADNE